MKTALRAAIAALAGIALVSGVVAIVLVAREKGGSNDASAHRPAASLPPRQAVDAARHVPCPTKPGTASRDDLKAFPASAVVVCRPQERRYADGDWSVEVKQVSHGRIAAFLDGLDRPDQPRPADQVCLDYLDISPTVALIADDGRSLVPTFPRDGCGHLQKPAKTRLAKLPMTTVSVRKLTLDRPIAAIDSGCEVAWKNENALDAADPRLRPTAPVLVPGRLRVCWYERTKDWMSGVFVRGKTLDPATSARLRDALSGAGVEARCPAQRHFAVVFAPNRAEVNVELGGCYRVQTFTGSGRADRAVVRPILG